jgi:putative flavoprotein involved in K+ transport
VHDVIIIGAGQGGLALSYHLCQAGVDHVILERGRIGNAWREDRWDSFCLVTPNWTLTLPGAEYTGDDPDGFLDRDEFVAYLEDWAQGFAAPVRKGVTVSRITQDGAHYLLETDQGALRARHAVVATATYQTPRRPPWWNATASELHCLNAAEYRNPATLPSGGVLVIGSGQSGCQIADELCTAGRDVVFSIGSSGRLPRRYRGQDCITWQRDMGWLDRTPDMLEHPSLRFRGDPHLTGARGGETLSLHTLAAKGVSLAGRIEMVERGIARFADDAQTALTHADDYATGFRAAVEEQITRAGISAPPPTENEMVGEPPAGGKAMSPITELDLKARDISTIISATGFSFDFSWIEIPVFDEFGYPVTDRGTTAVPGLHFMGLNWMHKRKSGIIYGVAEDAAHLGQRLISTLR